MPERGDLFIIDGWSGAGKTTLLRLLFGAMPELAYSVSVTTRPPRPGEVPGRDFHFVTTDKFERLDKHGLLLERGNVYGNRYGTLCEPVERTLASGQSIILEVDIDGANQVMRTYPDATRIFVVAPSLEVLEQRLRDRGTEDEAGIQRRLQAAQEKLDATRDWDFFVINRDRELPRSLNQLLRIVTHDHHHS